jgi:hypothetical protein
VELIQAGVDVVDAVMCSAIDSEHCVRQRVKTATIINPRKQVEVRLCFDLSQ